MSDDPENRVSAGRTLIEYSMDADPVVRLKCVLAFRNLRNRLNKDSVLDQSERLIIDRLASLADNDQEKSVRTAAKDTLEELGQ